MDNFSPVLGLRLLSQLHLMVTLKPSPRHSNDAHLHQFGARSEFVTPELGVRLMPKSKLTPEGEVIAAYGAAMVAAFQVLINCLEESDALLPG